jgi:uncharacterized delta-60 repeat protein
MKRILILLFALIGSSRVLPQAGMLDPTFADNGVAITDFGVTANIGGDICQQMLLHPDGSFFLILEMNEQTMITHRLPDGALDKGFGKNGYSVAVFMRDPSAVLQPDGKIVVGGFTMINNSTDFVLARFNSNGTLDASFSGDGLVKFDFSSTPDYVNDLVLQTDGKIVAVGRTVSQMGSLASLARINADGSLDNSFGTNGKLVSSTVGSYNAVAIQADGKIVVAGDAQSHVVVARYLANGSVDNSFSGTGTAFIYSGLASSANALAIQGDGKLVVGGSVVQAGFYNFLVLRLLANGTPDPSFSTDGRQETDFGADDKVRGLTLQPDGKILAAGETSSGLQIAFAIARYNVDGSPDNSFSADGKQTNGFGGVVALGFDIAVQPGKGILIAGWLPVGNYTGYSVVRYLDDGTVDSSFATDGQLVDYKPVGYTYYKATAVQKDGKIVVAGLANTGNEFQFAVARYNTNGLLDAGFGQGGKRTIQFGSTSSIAYDVAIQPDGGIVVAGGAVDGAGSFMALARLNYDGSPDSSFNHNGRLVLDVGVTTWPYAKIALQKDDKIVIASFTDAPPLTGDIVLVRCLSTGAIDESFGNAGKVITNLGSNSDRVFDLLIQNDGKLVAVGAFDYNNESKVALVRYTIDGLPDGTFGSGGVVFTTISNRRDEAFAAALQTDGKIVVAGNITTDAGNDLLLVRYNSDGSLDNSFSGNGKLVFDMGSTSEEAQALAIEGNGKIITAGFTHDGKGNVSALACINPDGTLDTSFSADGKIVGVPDRAPLSGLAINGNRLYAVGSIMNDGTYMGLVATYLLGTTVTCPPSFTVSIPDAVSLEKGADPNTVYPVYVPASQITLTTKVAGSVGQYTYLWSDGSTEATNRVAPTMTTNYVVTVTDASGCKATTSKQVNAVDVQCANEKVAVCQVSPGNGKAKMVCVASSAVAALLKNGSKLGTCVQSTGTDRVNELITEQLELVVWPNPSSTGFRLMLTGTQPGLITLTVRDLLGRVVEQRKVNSQEVIELGANYQRGLYSVSLIQGSNTLTKQVVKQ